MKQQKKKFIKGIYGILGFEIYFFKSCSDVDRTQTKRQLIREPKTVNKYKTNAYDVYYLAMKVIECKMDT